jgi:hypothetical protein
MRPVVGCFDQAHASTDGGIMLLKVLDDRLHLTDQLAACLVDGRDPDKIRLTVLGARLNPVAITRNERPRASPGLKVSRSLALMCL